MGLCRARRELSKLVSATDLTITRLDGGEEEEEEKDLEKEEIAVIQMSEMQIIG